MFFLHIWSYGRFFVFMQETVYGLLISDWSFHVCSSDLMLAALAGCVRLPDRRRDILDLGCGTGLSGLPFRPYARRLEGIDLAPAMIEQSQRRGIYDSLHQGEIHAVLAALPDASFDLVLAADTLIYIGDIDALTGAVARILKPGGSFLFTVETGAPGSGFRLTRTEIGRAHV